MQMRLSEEKLQGMAQTLSMSILALCGLAECASMLGAETDEEEYLLNIVDFQEHLLEEFVFFYEIKSVAAAAAA